MHRIDTATKAPDLFGAGKDGFKDGDKASGIAATDLTAAFFNDVQENIAGVIEGAGDALVKGDGAQVLTAIRRLFQKAAAVSAAASGTVDAITANFTPAIAALSDHLLLIVRAGGANTSTTPTFTPASATIAAKTIVKGHNQALVAGDISGAGFRAELQYDAPLDKWVLLNPATGVSITTVPDATTVVKGKVQLAVNADATAMSDSAKAIVPSNLPSVIPGVNQTYQNHSGSRVSGTTYINTTGKMIKVILGLFSTAAQPIVDGYYLPAMQPAGSNTVTSFTFDVPAGLSYRVDCTNIVSWSELRS